MHAGEANLLQLTIQQFNNFWTYFIQLNTTPNCILQICYCNNKQDNLRQSSFFLLLCILAFAFLGFFCRLALFFPLVLVFVFFPLGISFAFSFLFIFFVFVFASLVVLLLLVFLLIFGGPLALLSFDLLALALGTSRHFVHTVLLFPLLDIHLVLLVLFFILVLVFLSGLLICCIPQLLCILCSPLAFWEVVDLSCPEAEKCWHRLLGFVLLRLLTELFHLTSNQIIAIPQQHQQISNHMKAFQISELLIYDPTRQSSKRKPIQIDIQQAKIVAYYPWQVPLQQKCNTVGMAQGVYNFCHSLLVGKDVKQEKKERGWQTIFMDTCTLILSEVEQNIWIFVRLDHAVQSKYYRLGEHQNNYYLDQSLTDNSCRLFMDQLYFNFKLFYGNLRGWVFREKFQQLQRVLTAYVLRFQEIYKLQGKLDLLSFTTKDLRMIPLDVNSTLKFSYFKNVLQSYNQNIAHLIIYAYGILAYSSLGKDTTHLISKYLFSTGEPYIYSEQHKNRMNMLSQLPRNALPEKFGVIYNSKVIGFEDVIQGSRQSLTIKSQGIDLLGLNAQTNSFELFEMFIEEEQLPLKVNFYSENNMFFVTFYRSSPTYSQIIFQNRFYHDNADKFILKISQSIPGLLKPNDPYKFVFHNIGTYTGKSTIKEWKNFAYYIRNALELVQATPEGVAVTSTPFGFWVYGVHRFSRILVLLVPTDLSLARVEDYVNKMTKQYFARAYV